MEKKAGKRRLAVLLLFWSLELGMLSSAAHANAVCATGTGEQPRGIIGLQLFYPDDERSWIWARELGVSWLRLELRWDEFEPEKGERNWSRLNKIMALAAEQNQKIMILFNHAPRWAQMDTKHFAASATNAIVAIAQRYHRKISAWEIFNEPNLPGYGWPSSSDIEAGALLYAETLAEVSAGIRSIDKQALIVSAGLSPQNDPELFFRIIVRHTPPDCYDAIGLHPYGERGRFKAVTRNVSLLLQQEGLPEKPVWFTEYGSNDNDERSDLLHALFDEASSVPITFWFTERDIESFDGSYGLRHSNGSPKRDYEVFQTLLSQYLH